MGGLRNALNASGTMIVVQTSVINLLTFDGQLEHDIELRLVRAVWHYVA